MSQHARGPDDGQASVEWIGLVLLVVVLLGLGAAMAQAGFLGRQVTREMARALCRVRSGDCERDHQPCVVRSEQGKGSMTFSIAVVRLGGGYEALVAQRSDGTYAVTRATNGSFGVEAGVGPSAELHAGPLRLTVSAALQASATGRRQRGRTWIVPTRADADALVRRLRLGGGGAPRAPDLVSGSQTLAALAGADVTAQAGGVLELDAAHGGLTFDRRAAAEVDRRTGHRTVSVTSSATAGLEVAGGVLGLSRSTPAGETYAVDFDASGRPVDLQITAAGVFGGSQDLPAVVQPVAGLLAAGEADGRAFAVTAHLDLTDPADLAAARGLLRAIAAPGWRADLPAATQALRRRVDERGTVEARVLHVAHDATDSGAVVGFGGRFGGQVHVEHTETRLLAATSRGLDGRWITRTDCVA